MLMTPQIATLLAIILGALILFSIEVIPADVIAIGVLLVLTISGLLPAELAFAGFGSDVVITITGCWTSRPVRSWKPASASSVYSTSH